MNYTEEDYIVEKIKGKVGTTVTFANGEKVVVTLPYEQWKHRKDMISRVTAQLRDGLTYKIGF